MWVLRNLSIILIWLSQDTNTEIVSTRTFRVKQTRGKMKKVWNL